MTNKLAGKVAVIHRGFDWDRASGREAVHPRRYGPSVHYQPPQGCARCCDRRNRREDRLSTVCRSFDAAGNSRWNLSNGSDLHDNS